VDAKKSPNPPAARSRNMAAVRGKNTKPELIVRRLLHGAGFRYRLHSKKLPGTPDISLRKWNAVVEIQGCFWHAHDCHLFKRPVENARFWSDKHRANIERDLRNAKAISDLGIRRLIVWECALKGRNAISESELTRRISQWLRGSRRTGDITGRN
jgi:DNA mismatch endonuclease, patch repair protein